MKLALGTSRALVALALLAGSALALPAPQNFSADVVGDNVEFSWDAVEGAAKYSVDVDAAVTLVDGSELSAELSYGTSDRTDGGDMADPDLTVPAATILSDLAAVLGVEVNAIAGVDALARVKALNPGRGKGRQNNPFSNTDSFTLP